MLHLLLSACLLGRPAPFPLADTLNVSRLPLEPVLDGRVGAREYGIPAVDLRTAAGDVHVWIGRMAANIYFAATIPDSTFHWGDDFVVSLDPNGSGGGSPGAGDQQWYLRRVLDSIVVALAENGRWYSQGHEPPMLGSSRHDADWDVASTSSSSERTI